MVSKKKSVGDGRGKTRRLNKERSDKTVVSEEEYDRMVQSSRGTLWGYAQLFGTACDFVGRNFGDGAVRKLHIEAGKTFAHSMLKLGGPECMRLIWQTLKNGGSEFTIEENDEEIVVTGTCNTGGRYAREGLSAYNSEGVPYYCVHCPIWWQEMPSEFGLKMTFEMGDRGRGCTWRLRR